LAAKSILGKKIARAKVGSKYPVEDLKKERKKERKKEKRGKEGREGEK